MGRCGVGDTVPAARRAAGAEPNVPGERRYPQPRELPGTGRAGGTCRDLAGEAEPTRSYGAGGDESVSV